MGIYPQQILRAGSPSKLEGMSLCDPPISGLLLSSLRPVSVFMRQCSTFNLG